MTVRKWMLYIALFGSLGSQAQVLEGMQHYDPIGETAREVETAGARHSHVRPLNPFLEREIIKKTADSTLVDTTRLNRFRIDPLLDLGVGASAFPTPGMAGVGSAGVQASYFRGNRFYLRGAYQVGYLYFPDHLERRVNGRGILVGQGEARSLGEMHYAHIPTGSVGLRMGDHFSLEAGREQHFVGDGHRSMVLSHNAAPLPYLRLSTKVWRLKYVNLWTAMQDLNPVSLERRNKFMAMHALSWNIGDRFNVSVYEAVVWQTEDRLVNRGFDFSYLNPFVFYRPVEFAQGSADNMLLGMSFRVDLDRRMKLYGQLYFDEIKIDFLRARNGWWGNKFAVQLGFKAWDVFAEGHSFLSEFNLVRPFTYTHGSVVQAYGHMNQSLAHPLGTNFAEWLTRNRYEFGAFQINNSIVWAAYGLNSAGQNLGGEVFTSYTGPFRQFGNSMFQGERHTLLLVDTEVARALKGGKLFAFANLGLRKIWNSTSSPTDAWLMFGIRSRIVRPYRDF